MSSFGKFVLGTIVGGTIGAVIGVLLAPRSGSETRELIREEFAHRYNDSVDTVKGKTDELKSRAKQLSEELEETGRRTVGKLSKIHRGQSRGDLIPRVVFAL